MNSDAITIRPARVSDLDALHRLEVECVGGQALPPAQFRWLLESQGPDPSFIVRVAVDADRPDEPMGFICWKRKPDAAAPAYEILDLSVGKLYREERVEHALLADAIERATADEMFGIAVNVARANLAAAAFYLSHGFNVGHTVENYYADGTAMEVFLKRIR
ncbi:MAG: GNAT family N-acetyltransferase [Bdellovibrionales bacterium]|nr:GNAT family N-acetyltransferase [Bdellovibrionales bacterium]